MLEAQLRLKLGHANNRRLQQELARDVPNIPFDREHNQSQSVYFC
jgi:hypothetical protein